MSGHRPLSPDDAWGSGAVSLQDWGSSLSVGPWGPVPLQNTFTWFCDPGVYGMAGSLFGFRSSGVLTHRC